MAFMIFSNKYMDNNVKWRWPMVILQINYIAWPFS